MASHNTNQNYEQQVPAASNLQDQLAAYSAKFGRQPAPAPAQQPTSMHNNVIREPAPYSGRAYGSVHNISIFIFR